jgi:hypothetical protein
MMATEYTRVTAAQIFVKHPDAARTIPAVFSRELNVGETLTGSPTATASPSGLTVASVSIEGSAFTTEEGETIAASEAVKFKVSGGAEDTDYEVKVSCGTSIGDTLVMVCRVQVRAR